MNETFCRVCLIFMCYLFFNNTCIYVLHSVFIYYTQGSHWKRKWCLAVGLRQLKKIFMSRSVLHNLCGLKNTKMGAVPFLRLFPAQQPYRPHTHVNNQTAGLISCSCNWPAVASGQIRRVTSRRWWRQESGWSFDLPPEHTVRQTDRGDRGGRPGHLQHLSVLLCLMYFPKTEPVI